MKLSQHFTLKELTDSNKARQLGLDNTPAPELLPRLMMLAEMLERVRATLDAPVIVTSGYRCPPVNRAVGGVTSSDHTQGHAADFVAPGFGAPSEVARLLAPLVDVLGIGQILLEHVGSRSWVHVSTRIPDKVANRVLTFNGRTYAIGIQTVA